MKIALVRHGEAEHPRAGDAERALTDRGLKQARLTADWLRSVIGEQGGGMALVTSPYRRARQTAAVIGEALGLGVDTLDAITPDVDPRNALNALGQHASGLDWLIVVSHMPLVAALAHWLESGALGAGSSFTLAEVRILETEVLGPGLATLCGSFVPDMPG